MSYEELKISKIKKVRKEHRCEWCNFLIHIGHPAIYRVYLFDRDFLARHMHPECYDAMNNLDENCLREHEDNGFEEGSFNQGGLICDNCDYEGAPK